MKFLRFSQDGSEGLAVETKDGFRGLMSGDPAFPGNLFALINEGGDALARAARVLEGGAPIDEASVTFLPPIDNAEKIVCVGLNYADHTKEGGFEQPDYPTLFARFNSSLIAHNDALILPKLSDKFDYEGELVAVIGKQARNVSKADALAYVAGYSIFNDGSVRDYQTKAPQWTAGKNFDGTGAFGPYFTTADALPPGCKGLKLETRLNGQTLQSAPIDDMVFPVDELVSILSQFMTLKAGDVIVTGTPSGVGFARKPPIYMKDGDVCEVEIDQIGTLSNPVRSE